MDLYSTGGADGHYIFIATDSARNDAVLTSEVFPFKTSPKGKFNIRHIDG